MTLCVVVFSQSHLLTEYGRVFLCAVCLTVCAFGSMVAGLLNDTRHIVGMIYWLCAGLCMTITVIVTMPSYLAKPVLYMFIGRMLVPNIASQFSYWLRAGPDCVVDGPHFNWTFLLTWNALAQSLFAFIGVALFQRYVSKWTFRRAFLVTSLLQQLTCIFDIAMVMRWNRKMGIPDKVWYFCSASIIEEVASMWAFMPGCVLISRLCPKNIESTMYAVVAGLQNFAQSMSKFSGNFLCYTVLGIRTLPTAESGCDFTNLPLAIGLAMGACPLLPISLTFWLVPNIYMDEMVLMPEAGRQRAAAAAAATAAAGAAGAASPTPTEPPAAAPAPELSAANATTATPEASPSPPESPSDDTTSGAAGVQAGSSGGSGRNRKDSQVEGKVQHDFESPCTPVQKGEGAPKGEESLERDLAGREQEETLTDNRPMAASGILGRELDQQRRQEAQQQHEQEALQHAEQQQQQQYEEQQHQQAEEQQQQQQPEEEEQQ